MRPVGSTPVASTIKRPGPASANWPRCIRCQSPTEPSLAEYWHIGATTTRFAKVVPRSVNGENRWDGMALSGGRARA